MFLPQEQALFVQKKSVIMTELFWSQNCLVRFPPPASVVLKTKGPKKIPTSTPANNKQKYLSRTKAPRPREGVFSRSPQNRHIFPGLNYVNANLCQTRFLCHVAPPSSFCGILFSRYYAGSAGRVGSDQIFQTHIEGDPSPQTTVGSGA